MEYKKSIEKLKKESKYTLDKVVIGESDLRRGQTDLRSTGKQIQSLIGSIYKAESTAAGINHLSSFFIVLVILQLNLELDLPRIGYAQPSDCSFYILL